MYVCVLPVDQSFTAHGGVKVGVTVYIQGATANQTMHLTAMLELSR